METIQEKEPLAASEEKEESYVPRPTWQVWCARLGLILFIILVIIQIVTIARGGL